MQIVLISHLLDFSGAPIALLNLARTLIQQGHSVFLASMNDGPLGHHFGEAGVQAFDASASKYYDLFFANTFLTIPLAFRLAPDENKVMAWIHESRNFFGIYGIDEKKFEIGRVKRIFFPSRFMIEEYRDLAMGSELRQLRNLVSMTGVQRTDFYHRYFAVTGAWEPRKNQEKLLALADETRSDMRFNFIGSTKPENIKEDKHNFFGQVPLSHSKMLIASSFGIVSAAKSETQNLAAIESVLAENPVLLSDIPAHRELKNLIPHIVLFDAEDSDSFRRGYESFLAQKQDARLLDEGKKAADSYFGTMAFSDAVRSVLKTY